MPRGCHQHDFPPKTRIFWGAGALCGMSLERLTSQLCFQPFSGFWEHPGLCPAGVGGLWEQPPRQQGRALSLCGAPAGSWIFPCPWGNTRSFSASLPSGVGRSVPWLRVQTGWLQPGYLYPLLQLSSRAAGPRAGDLWDELFIQLHTEQPRGAWRVKTSSPSPLGQFWSKSQISSGGTAGGCCDAAGEGMRGFPGPVLFAHPTAQLFILRRVVFSFR